jgi:C4-dicarboxylate-specific signal transduction histidine kinase
VAHSELLRVERIARLGELVASLAHELRQPLAAILITAQAGLGFLKSEALNLDALRTVLENIVQDDKRAAGIITGLQSMVKKEERRMERINLNDVLRDVLILFRTEAIFRGLSIETELTEPLPLVHGDSIQLQQVMINLLMNAAEAMADMPHDQRKIILRTQETDRGIQVIVRDFGKGIDPNKLDGIWEPFFTTKDTGLGMGLSVCRSIVQKHEGVIWAKNNPDKGISVALVIPADDDKKL